MSLGDVAHCSLVYFSRCRLQMEDVEVFFFLTTFDVSTVHNVQFFSFRQMRLENCLRFFVGKVVWPQQIENILNACMYFNLIQVRMIFMLVQKV